MGHEYKLQKCSCYIDTEQKALWARCSKSISCIGDIETKQKEYFFLHPCIFSKFSVKTSKQWLLMGILAQPQSTTPASLMQPISSPGKMLKQAALFPSFCPACAHLPQVQLTGGICLSSLRPPALRLSILKWSRSKFPGLRFSCSYFQSSVTWHKLNGPMYTDQFCCHVQKLWSISDT